ncbi:hypothetical protein BE221DRAFT_76644, partial [Ostreococcus tauri]
PRARGRSSPRALYARFTDSFAINRRPDLACALNERVRSSTPRTSACESSSASARGVQSARAPRQHELSKRFPSRGVLSNQDSRF